MSSSHKNISFTYFWMKRETASGHYTMYYSKDFVSTTCLKGVIVAALELEEQF